MTLGRRLRARFFRVSSGYTSESFTGFTPSGEPIYGSESSNRVGGYTWGAHSGTISSNLFSISTPLYGSWEEPGVEIVMSRARADAGVLGAAFPGRAAEAPRAERSRYPLEAQAVHPPGSTPGVVSNLQLQASDTWC
jgi:hypothetical protein